MFHSNFHSKLLIELKINCYFIEISFSRIILLYLIQHKEHKKIAEEASVTRRVTDGLPLICMPSMFFTEAAPPSTASMPRLETFNFPNEINRDRGVRPR